MKRPKERLYKVLVIGATPAGIVATNQLGELGIPVTLVDSEPDLDKKLASEAWRLDSGVLLNYAHRAGLLRILRNNTIHCILPGRVTSIKHTPQGFRSHITRLQTFVDPDKCILCGRCVELCPVTLPGGEKPIRFNGRGSLPGRIAIDKRQKPLCQAHCPLGVNAQAYIALAREGRYDEALEVVRRDNILPGICGRVCTHPCEEACRRGELDDPIAIRDIKRFLADHEGSLPDDLQMPERLDTSKNIAVIGSGPAGLAVAGDLARFGHQVTVFEKEAEPGGLLRYGLGAHRLPREILDRELEYIKRMGVRFKTSTPVQMSDGLEALKKEFDRVVLTTGSWTDRKLGAPGEDLDGVEGGISFLNRFYRGEISSIKGSVAVIGDGNAAFDLARVLRRTGAEVTLLSWFPEHMIPADEQEKREAREEGVIIKDRTQVVAFAGTDGKMDALRCRPTEPGEPDENGIPWPVIIPDGDAFELHFDRAFVAIGQVSDLKEKEIPKGLKLTGAGYLEVDQFCQTTLEGVYAAGDGVKGPSSVVEAMASGRAAARSIHELFCKGDFAHKEPSRPDDGEFPEIPADIPSSPRPTMPERQPATRVGSFSEVALGLSEAQTQFEAERCLQCGICSECLICKDACSAIGAIDHHEKSQDILEHAGIVIIADPSITPTIRGEDVIRAYGPKAAKTDVYAMITRGFAAAAKAMTLLSGTSQRPKGHGVSFTPPEPELSPDIRLGVFVCRCNDAFGWHDEMNGFVEELNSQSDIIHTEVLDSACIPEGSASILRAIREKGLTRAVVASCVCCPLDFVCSACTDQRSRLKGALFQGTGVGRSMVETCNLRGEVLRHLHFDTKGAITRFKGLIDRSVQRAKKLRLLPAPARNYNFTTAIVGESEAALNSAETLAEAGFEVFLCGTPNHPLSQKIDHPNVYYYEGSAVTAMTGSLGNFQLFMQSGDLNQVLQVGTVILGEKSRQLIPYIHQDGIPSRIVASSMQKKGVQGVPYLRPGTTSIAGLFLANPPGVHVSEKKKGAAAAVLAAATMPRGPRQSKGYTVVVDEQVCRGCGRCMQVCPYHAITFDKNEMDGWHAVVDEALCKGCGNCISVCPNNAADSPYRDETYLEEMLQEVLIQ